MPELQEIKFSSLITKTIINAISEANKEYANYVLSDDPSAAHGELRFTYDNTGVETMVKEVLENVLQELFTKHVPDFDAKKFFDLITEAPTIYELDRLLATIHLPPSEELLYLNKIKSDLHDTFQPIIELEGPLRDSDIRREPEPGAKILQFGEGPTKK